MSVKTPTLPPRCCAVCGTTEKPRRCVRCKVEFYCSPEHQKKHYPIHKDDCRSVANAKSNADAEEQKLRSLPENVFETSVGRFWGIRETRDYMLARHDVFQALAKIKTQDSMQMQVDLLMDLLRLCRSDNMRVRRMVPAPMQQLGHDQDCYDFIKWYGTTGQRADYDWDDMSLGFLDIKNADAFEPVDYMCGGSVALNHIAQLTLLKIKLLLDLKGLQNSIRAVGEKVPVEVLNLIQTKIPLSSIITGNKKILYRRDHTETIEKLATQVETLYSTGTTANKYFWPGMLDPEKHLDKLLSRLPASEMYSPGSVEEMIVSVLYNYETWFETPGAIDVIKELAAKNGILERPLTV